MHFTPGWNLVANEEIKCTRCGCDIFNQFFAAFFSADQIFVIFATIQVLPWSRFEEQLERYLSIDVIIKFNIYN